MIWLLVDSRTVGGIERHVATLAQALERHGEAAKVVLYAAHPTNPWLTQLEAASVPYQSLDGTFQALRRAVAEDKPDLIHTHGYKANILGRLVGRGAGIPVVATFHAGERAPFPVSLYQTVDEWTSAVGGRIAVSEMIKQSLPYSSTFVQNFLIVPPKPQAQALPRRIGFVGRLSFEKGPDTFCEIARRCQDLGEWHIWGDGPMRLELEQAFGEVTFHGLVTDLAPVWRSLGLLMMPSRAEGLPMAALEALCAGVPIAASAVGGLPSLVTEGKTGWLFDAGQVEAAVQVVRKWAALETDAQLAIRAACWEHVSSGFSEGQQLPKIIEVYRAAGLKRH